MRAFFISDINKDNITYEVTGEDFVHFTKVLRGKKDSEVLLLNGKGLVAHSIVEEVEKKKLIVKVNKFEEVSRLVKSQIALCVPKKDYLEDILKMVTEVGVEKIHLIVSDNTPWKFKYSDRFDKIIKSALLQSNNAYLPDVVLYKSLNDFLRENEKVSIVSFMTEESGADRELTPECALIGPEGGFSISEIELIKGSKNVTIKKLPNPIMKSVTASIFALGHIQ